MNEISCFLEIALTLSICLNFSPVPLVVSVSSKFLFYALVVLSLTFLESKALTHTMEALCVCVELCWRNTELGNFTRGL